MSLHPGITAVTLCVACILVALHNPALAAEAERRIEVVTVTGTSIKRTDADGPAPVDVYPRTEIEASGVATLDEFFRTLPQALGPVSETFQTSGFSGAGYVNLRGIGIDNTLTLVNGKRISGYASNSASEPFVDINAIPLAAIERVEVLKDGASAIYGSDAVAGVVNFILRDEFEGTAVSGGYLSASEGDGEEFNADIVWGGKVGETQLLASLSWFDKSPILARNRERAADVDFSGQGGPNFRSFNGTPSTYFLLPTFESRPDAECGQNPRISSLESHPFFGDFCGFNFAHFQQLSYDTQRLSAVFVARHKFGAELQGSLEAFVSTRDNLAQVSPTPVMGPIIPADHPNNPFGVPASMAARPLDTGDRLFDTASDTYRLVLGLEGVLSRWDWAADVLLTGNDAETQRHNAVFSDRFQAALDGMGGPGGNLRYNPFGANPQNDPELIDWLTTSTVFGADTTENSLELKTTTDFGKLAGGPVDFAAGLQYREQDLDEFADDTERSGLLAGGSQITQIDADRDITAAYIEFGVPLTEKVEVQLALRHDDYSDFGGTTNPKLALAWQPTEDFLVRTSYGTSFRPPTFTELFNPSVINSGFFVDTVRCEVSGAPADCAPREIPLRNVGNPELEPEEGESSFFGITWSPGFVDGLDLRLEYWRFEHTERIIELDPQLILDGGSNQGVIRDVPSTDDIALGIPGPILELTETFANSDNLETSGVDFLAHYRFDTKAGGNYSATLNYTYVDEYRLNEASLGSAAPDTNFAGRYFNREFAIPRNRADVGVSWSQGRHGVNAILHLVGDYEGLFPVHENGVPTDTPFIVDDYASLDLQYSFQVGNDATEIQIGCRNCTNEKPPVTFNFFGEGLYDYRNALVYGRIRHTLQGR